INSLKLNEYLAAGLPVVALDLPMVADVRNLLFVAQDQDEFLARVREARASLGPDDAARAARRRYAAGQDWESRVSEIGTHVESELARAGAAGSRPISRGCSARLRAAERSEPVVRLHS